jgi:hypothetical protein
LLWLKAQLVHLQLVVDNLAKVDCDKMLVKTTARLDKMTRLQIKMIELPDNKIARLKPPQQVATQRKRKPIVLKGKQTARKPMRIAHKRKAIEKMHTKIAKKLVKTNNSICKGGGQPPL